MKHMRYCQYDLDAIINLCNKMGRFINVDETVKSLRSKKSFKCLINLAA